MSDNNGLNTVDICATLLRNLSQRGLQVSEINQLVKDVFGLLKNGGSFTVAFVNYELELMGWGSGIFDEIIFEMIFGLL